MGKKQKFEVKVTITVKARDQEQADAIAAQIMMYGSQETAYNTPPTGFKEWAFDELEDENGLPDLTEGIFIFPGRFA